MARKAQIYTNLMFVSGVLYTVGGLAGMVWLWWVWR
jgi:hypothetical protein